MAGIHKKLPKEIVKFSLSTPSLHDLKKISNQNGNDLPYQWKLIKRRIMLSTSKSNRLLSLSIYQSFFLFHISTHIWTWELRSFRRNFEAVSTVKSVATGINRKWRFWPCFILKSTFLVTELSVNIQMDRPTLIYHNKIIKVQIAFNISLISQYQTNILVLYRHWKIISNVTCLTLSSVKFEKYKLLGTSIRVISLCQKVIDGWSDIMYIGKCE